MTDDARRREATPRQKVLKVMRQMAKASALVGLSAAESCSSPMVCDPLPPSITCRHPTHSEVAQAMQLVAQWAVTDGGARTVELDVSDYGIQALAFSEHVVARGATVISATASSNRLVILLAPDPGATSLQVDVGYDCEGTSQSLTASLDLRATQPGAIPVELLAP